MICAPKLFLVASMLWAATICSVAAERGWRGAAAASKSDDASGRQLLTAEQGEALVDFAMESAADLRSQPDCSHLVHLVYSRAGLNYPYQHSRVLYVGVPDFDRVKNPQAGDLIVWPGHVGLVVSAENRVFFSSVRSGIITESWTADYWLARGQPRFFRYRISAETDLALLASVTADSIRVPTEARGEDAGDPTTEASNQSGGGGEQVPVREMGSSKKSTSAHSGENGREALPGTPEPAAGRLGSGGRQAEASFINPGEDPTSVVAVIRQRGKPSKQAIAAAFAATCEGNARKLIAAKDLAGSLNPERLLSVVVRAQVMKIKIGRRTGTVTLKLSEMMSLQQGRVLPARITQREFSISRTASGGSAAWAILDPHRRVYIPQAQALSVFEAQAELLLHQAPDSRATRTMVKALDVLYDQQPDPAQRAALK